LDVQKRDFEAGFPSYLAGRWAETGWWYWYACAFVVKEPLGFQILLVVSVLNGLCKWRRWTRESVSEWSMILVPPAVTFALVSSQTGFTHHLRYMLPAYPFLFVLASRVMSLGAGGKWLTVLCLLWQSLNVLCAAPHWMSWFNEAAGGPQNGSNWLLHSNLDWGQDLLFLKQWQQAHPEAMPLHAALMTACDPRDLGLQVRPGVPCLKGRPDVVNVDGLRGPVAGWHAISVNLLNARVISETDSVGLPATSGRFVYFREHFRSVDQIGDTILIFNLTAADVANARGTLSVTDPEPPIDRPECPTE
jgi:hypothetical protein